MTPADLTQFHEEVVRTGAAALLPQNLSDRWLRLLLADNDAFRGVQNGHNFDGLALAVSTLLRATVDTEVWPDGRIDPYLLTTSLHAYSLNLLFEAIYRKDATYPSTRELYDLPTLENVLDLERIRKLGRTDS